MATVFANQIDNLAFLQTGRRNVARVHHHYAALAVDAAIAIVQAVDGGVVLVVAAHGHHQEAPRSQLDVRDRVHGEARLAAVYGEGALARAVGRKRAVEMLLTGEAIDAATAADWGLVNRVAPAAVVPTETRTLLALATRGSALSKGLGKQAFYRQVDLPQPDAYDFATEAMTRASQTHDAKEGMRSFIEKRRPNFQDR